MKHLCTLGKFELRQLTWLAFPTSTHPLTKTLTHLSTNNLLIDLRVTYARIHPLEHDAFDGKIRKMSNMVENKVQFLFARAGDVRHVYAEAWSRAASQIDI